MIDGVWRNRQWQVRIHQTPNNNAMNSRDRELTSQTAVSLSRSNRERWQVGILHRCDKIYRMNTHYEINGN